ncbi:hypothetical protein [Fangia hongkongensis]|uniref:hypothetical protein n=1 Tax=Fangia hongkongensis TaxID=270495 RepID=UPI0012B52468|nr:hypothetical protein [Fangia hongkongensis]MBK2125845.1 hypothetical protein [Fangia hongkongensis]
MANQVVSEYNTHAAPVFLIIGHEHEPGKALGSSVLRGVIDCLVHEHQWEPKTLMNLMENSSVNIEGKTTGDYFRSQHQGEKVSSYWNRSITSDSGDLPGKVSSLIDSYSVRYNPYKDLDGSGFSRNTMNTLNYLFNMGVSMHPVEVDTQMSIDSGWHARRAFRNIRHQFYDTGQKALVRLKELEKSGEFKPISSTVEKFMMSNICPIDKTGPRIDPYLVRIIAYNVLTPFNLLDFHLCFPEIRCFILPVGWWHVANYKAQYSTERIEVPSQQECLKITLEQCGVRGSVLSYFIDESKGEEVKYIDLYRHLSRSEMPSMPSPSSINRKVPFILDDDTLKKIITKNYDYRLRRIITEESPEYTSYLKKKNCSLFRRNYSSGQISGVIDAYVSYPADKLDCWKEIIRPPKERFGSKTKWR